LSPAQTRYRARRRPDIQHLRKRIQYMKKPSKAIPIRGARQLPGAVDPAPPAPASPKCREEKYIKPSGHVCSRRMADQQNRRYQNHAARGTSPETTARGDKAGGKKRRKNPGKKPPATRQKGGCFFFAQTDGRKTSVIEEFIFFFS